MLRVVVMKSQFNVISPCVYIPVHLLRFRSLLHLKHANLHSLPSYINSILLLSELHQVMVLPLFRHLLYFLALVPGACPGFYYPLYILVKGFTARDLQGLKQSNLNMVCLFNTLHGIHTWSPEFTKCLSLSYPFSS